MPDESKANELMFEWMGEIASPVEEAIANGGSPQLRKDASHKMRKILDKYYDHYCASGCRALEGSKLNGGNYEKTQWADIPEPEDKDLKPFNKKMMPIFKLFNGINSSRLRDMFENYLDKIKEGWNKKIEQLNQQ